MIREIYTAAMGMMPQQTRLEVIANNMANANTVGFKRSSVFERNLIEAKGIFFNVPGDVEQNDPPSGSYIDYSNGAYEQTGNKLDLAIQNQTQFFVLENEHGDQVFTKAGRFQLGVDGTIITMDGNKLMGTNGVLTIPNKYLADNFNTRNAQSVEIRISDTGEVFVNEKEIGAILIANVDNIDSLQNISKSNFIATKDAFIDYVPQDEVSLRQGWLEGSNVDIISEMVNMIELQRMYEAGSKVIHTNNETLTKSIAVGKYF